MPVRTRLLPRTSGLAAAGVLLLVLLASAAPASATTPPLRVTFAPATLPAGAPAGTVPAGAAAATVHADLVNPSRAERVGSANLVPPAGFVVSHVSLPPRTGGAGVNAAGTVELRGLSLNANSSLRVTLTLQAPCEAPSPSTWGVTAKKSTSYSGTALAISSTSALVTGVRGTCTLLWGDPKPGSPGVADREPTAAKVGDVITSVPYTPSGPSVRVAVHDGDGVVVAPAPGTLNAVAVDVTSRIGTGELTGGASALTGTAGYATFAALKIEEAGIPRAGAGTYALRASVTSGRFAGLATKEAVVRADTIVRQCTSVSCLDEKLRGGSGVFSVGAGSGTDAPFLTLSVDAGVSLSEAQCDGWKGYTSSTALFNVNSDQRTKTISLTIDKPAMNEVSDNGAPRLELCFGSPVEFTAKRREGGALYTTPVTGQFDWNADGRPEDVYSGLLPDCSATVTLCVTKRKKVGAGDGYIQATVPERIGDPLMRG